MLREIIRRKRDGQTLSREQIEHLVAAASDANAGSEQLGAFVMAVFLKGMDDEETTALTEAMRDSGQVLRWNDPALPGPVLDKHSTGGVGDCTSLLVGPWVAACGGFVPMITGAGLGHTGGTLDKLAAIPGYVATPELTVFRRVVREAGVAIIGQTDELATADRRLYAIRDITSTVESLPLIVASILSKKLAEGLDALVMDIKTGNGSVMPDLAEARRLADALGRVARRAGTTLTSVLSDMNQPLASSAGNALEVAEIIAVLTGRRRGGRLQALSHTLAAQLLVAGGLAGDSEQADRCLQQAWDSGAVAERFGRMVRGLGGPADLLEHPHQHLPAAPVVVEVHAKRSGQVGRIDTRALGFAVVALGGGRRRAGDRIDPRVGLSDLVSLGDSVVVGQPLARVHAADHDSAEAAAGAVQAAVDLTGQTPQAPALVVDILPKEAT
ncbi:MAG: thymidine phosphorylase [Pseudomonadota bacterium]|nr:MAG: thymidine phosphorylase [Pseudomonadota bacterium]